MLTLSYLIAGATFSRKKFIQVIRRTDWSHSAGEMNESREEGKALSRDGQVGGWLRDGQG